MINDKLIIFITADWPAVINDKLIIYHIIDLFGSVLTYFFNNEFPKVKSIVYQKLKSKKIDTDLMEIKYFISTYMIWPKHQDHFPF